MIKNSLDYERGPISHNPPANNEMDHDLARSISEKSHKNINLAKLRIDELEHSEQVEDVEVVRDRIPRSIIAFFDSEIGRILHLHPELSDLALMSICAVAESERAEGMSSEELEQRTRSERAKSLHLSQNPIRSLEDILRATNGLLVSKVYDEDEEILINCYSEMFAWYARDDYNIHLYRAKSKLDTVEPAADVYDCPDEEDEGIEVDDRTERAPSPIITPESLQNTDNSIPVLFRADSGYQSTGPSRQASTSSDIMTLKTIKDTELEDSEPEGAFQAPDNMPETDVCSTVRTGVDEAEFVESTLKSICSFCEEHIFQSSVAYSHHFSSLSDFETAWTPSCIFCSALYANIHPRQEESPATEENSMTWPLYSWTVRSTGRTHNKNPVLTVAFQPAGKGHSSAAPVNIKRFHVQAENEAQVESIPDENTVGKSTYPDDSGKQLKSWINTCDNSHPHCYKYREGSFVPTRLVDIQCEDQEMVRVVETGPNDIRTAYCTLSHTWGPPNFLQLTQSTKGRLMGPGVRLDELTKNFQEAICVARYIGVRYFWIDSLCIMQGKGGDFAHEGQLMHKVYRYSYCNIAIADSADSKGGLFRTREPDEILPGRYESNGMGKLDVGSWRILNADLWKEELLGTKIYTRGWVFQGKILTNGFCGLTLTTYVI